ncbi:DNA-directed RNA polymerase subunit delta [Kurthia sibirica]|uniref:Probable DNA-directed RNA polymerase subunit delta n=1 Tax=Kurthia sibirica TaxID=202750 RepID=A0A2U3AKU2_9BACL|nr:DNA-directed RNA polymerase subunit delta [Kurthia sibirica]PWI25153.1 DNA-directed RNA polymerase subunit delta [Kurthia sibirica]GEK33239.1 hypothetical protein KSI01_07720 [Kurthia sibirica]
MNLRELTQEQLTEESLINLAYGILVEQRKPLAFRDIITKIEKLKARTDAEIQGSLNQFYTDVNIDGRFIILAENRWGLREWYAIDQVEEETAPTVKARKKKAKVDDEEEEIDEVELELVEDFDTYEPIVKNGDDEEDDELAGLDVVDDIDEDEDLEIEIEIDLDDEDEDEEEDDKDFK